MELGRKLAQSRNGAVGTPRTARLHEGYEEGRRNRRARLERKTQRLAVANRERLIDPLDVIRRGSRLLAADRHDVVATLKGRDRAVLAMKRP